MAVHRPDEDRLVLVDGGALRIGHALGLTQYSAEQLDFLRYRPVLDNTALREEFGYTPMKTSREVFEFFVAHNLHATEHAK